MEGVSRKRPSEDDNNNSTKRINNSNHKDINEKIINDDIRSNDAASHLAVQSGDCFIFENDVEKVLAIRRVVDNDTGQIKEECLIKFKDTSYQKTTWEPRHDIEIDSKGKEVLKKFLKNREKDGLPIYSNENIQIEDLIDESKFTMERIVKTKIENDIYDKESEQWIHNVIMYYVKWEGLSYLENTWEYIEDVKEGKKQLLQIMMRTKQRVEKTISDLESSSTTTATTTALTRRTFQKLEKETLAVNNIELRKYQIDGIKWLMRQWSLSRGSILADEMGLGKTIQCIALVETLRHSKAIDQPVLIVVPLSTLRNWLREFDLHTDASVVLYNGSEENRKEIQNSEVTTITINSSKTYIPHFDVLLTTYDLIKKKSNTFLKHIKWSCMILDEAHKLKEITSLVRKNLVEYSVDFKLLLTGTPVQNNIDELYSLLNFMQPSDFPDKSSFIEKYGKLESDKQIKDMQSLLKKYLLRRTKEDAGIDLPTKTEFIIDIELTFDQKQFYRAFLEKKRGILGPLNTKLLNISTIFWELRKCCDHPFIVEGGQQYISENVSIASINKDSNDPLVTDPLIFTSGKMVFIHKLLPKLRREGSKVLIFSQLKAALDILQEYLIKYDFGYERLDGSVSELEREKSIRHFNDKNSTKLVFLLSTRAGGQGINLQAANIVIIFDSDFNPHNDLQAVCRCHRLGQEQEVKVFRLLTKNTVERHYFESAIKKLMLSEAVLSDHDKKEKDPRKLHELLRKGAIAFLGEDEETALKNSNAFINDDIDKILQSGYHHEDLITKAKSKSMFSEVTFEIDNSNSKDLDINADDFWEKALQVRESRISKLKNSFLENLTLLKSNKEMLRDVLEKVWKIVNDINDKRKSNPDETTEETQDTIDLIITVTTSGVLTANEQVKYTEIQNSIENPKRHRTFPTFITDTSRDFKISSKSKTTKTSSSIANNNNRHTDNKLKLSASDFDSTPLRSSMSFQLFARSFYHFQSRSSNYDMTNAELVDHAVSKWNESTQEFKYIWDNCARGIVEFINDATIHNNMNFNQETILNDFAQLTGLNEIEAYYQNVQNMHHLASSNATLPSTVVANRPAVIPPRPTLASTVAKDYKSNVSNLNEILEQHFHRCNTPDKLQKFLDSLYKNQTKTITDLESAGTTKTITDLETKAKIFKKYIMICEKRLQNEAAKFDK